MKQCVYAVNYNQDRTGEPANLPLWEKTGKKIIGIIDLKCNLKQSTASYNPMISMEIEKSAYNCRVSDI